MEITVLQDNSVTVTVLEGGPVTVRINGEAMVLEGSGPADEAVVPEGSGPADEAVVPEGSGPAAGGRS